MRSTEPLDSEAPECGRFVIHSYNDSLLWCEHLVTLEETVSTNTSQSFDTCWDIMSPEQIILPLIKRGEPTLQDLQDPWHSRVSGLWWSPWTLLWALIQVLIPSSSEIQNSASWPLYCESLFVCEGWWLAAGSICLNPAVLNTKWIWSRPIISDWLRVSARGQSHQADGPTLGGTHSANKVWEKLIKWREKARTEVIIFGWFAEAD